MTFQIACISADTPKCLHPMCQPRRLRALSPFARPVDETAPKIIRFTPPPSYTAVNYYHSRQEADAGGCLSSESQPKTRVLCTRLCSFASWHALAFASPRLPRGFSRCINRCNAEVYQRCSGENSLPTRGIKGQDNRGHPPTVILFSPRHARLSPTTTEAGVPYSFHFHNSWRNLNDKQIAFFLKFTAAVCRDSFHDGNTDRRASTTID